MSDRQETSRVAGTVAAAAVVVALGLYFWRDAHYQRRALEECRDNSRALIAERDKLQENLNDTALDLKIERALKVLQKENKALYDELADIEKKLNTERRKVERLSLVEKENAGLRKQFDEALRRKETLESEALRLSNPVEQTLRATGSAYRPTDTAPKPATSASP